MSVDTGLVTRQNGNKTVIEVDAQNVDYRNCESLKSAVSQSLGEGRKALILNMSKVSFMDSSGLGVLLFCKRSCDEAGATFAICGLQGYVSNLVQLTKLNKAISIFTTEEEAVKG